MKKIIIALTVLIIAQVGRAQLKGFSIGPYAEMGFPAGGFANTHNNGLGAGLAADIKLPGKLGLTGSVGYMQFGGKTLTTPEGASYKENAVKAFPIRAGLKFRALPLIYFKLEGGVANYTGNNSGSAVIASPGIGIRILNFELQGKYEAWFKDGTNGFWGLRAGINF